jgi:imidazolonepropionase-like amidohydrolase/Tol biopolymer transport system component
MKLNLTILLLLTTLSLFAQKKKAPKAQAPAKTETPKKWDVNNPPQAGWNWEDVQFTTDEGTWLNLDVSPDGKSIAFDMLGDIYSMPIAGGKATALRTGIAWEVQPRFSPDGKQILFTSDAGGGDNIWMMKADGTDAKQITKEDFRLLNNATWMPDGEYFIARKHFTSGRSLGAGEMWMYHKTGGEGLQLTERKNDQQDVNEPTVSPDGRYVYFSEDQYPGGYFQYNKDPNNQIYGIRRYDRQEGKLEDIISGPGGACRPQISNDGTKLAFIRRVRTQTTLWVRDLKTGQEFPLFDQLSKDQQEAWAIFGTYPGFDWMPTDNEIVIYGLGKIWRVPVMLGAEKPAKAVEIPFSVDVKMKVAETVRPKQKAFEEEMEVKVIRGAVTSPDGETIIFSAAGKLWGFNANEHTTNPIPIKKVPFPFEGLLEPDVFFSRNEEFLEFEPSFSPDGHSVVFTTWNDEELGKIMVVGRPGSKFLINNVKTLTTSPGIYRTPSFSPDGKQIVFVKEGGNSHQGFTHCNEPGIYIMPADGSAEPKLVTPTGEYPQFSADGKRIFYQKGGYLFGSLVKSVESVDLNGQNKQEHFDGKYSHRYVISPDNKWVAWSELFKVYVAPIPKTGKKVGLTSGTKAVPVAQVAKDAGINIHWSADSKTLHWTLGNEYFSDELTERFKFLEGSRDSLPPMDTAGIKINITLPADKPNGVIAFTNARIITMEGDQVIEKGTVVVEGNVIKAVSPDFVVPRGAKEIDCTGKTIMPGIIDAHAHSGNFRYGLSPQKQWEYYANLAYGVTTSHDPSANTEMVFAQSELIKSGNMVGPRLFSTGTILYGADGDFKAVINSLDDARSALRRTKAFGAFSVKSYNQPRREQRQQVIAAARELGIQVVPEGGSTFYHNLSEVVDGHTTVEHNIPIVPLYKDVTTLWAATRTHNTPTLIVNYGSLSGENYWYQKTNVWEKERLLAFTPRAVVDSRSRHRTMAPDEEYQNGHILTSQSLKKLADAGVKINLGAHGQLQGLGAHWELWMLQQGGMSNLEALKCATINGAISLGMEEQLGSIKVGKLADLIVLDKNPLENIQNSEFVKYTMVNGRLYDAATMNEIGNYDRKRTKFYFEMPGSGNGFEYFRETNSFMRPTCCQMD